MAGAQRARRRRFALVRPGPVERGDRAHTARSSTHLRGQERGSDGLDAAAVPAPRPSRAPPSGLSGFCCLPGIPVPTRLPRSCAGARQTEGRGEQHRSRQARRRGARLVARSRQQRLGHQRLQLRCQYGLHVWRWRGGLVRLGLFQHSRCQRNASVSLGAASAFAETYFVARFWADVRACCLQCLFNSREAARQGGRAHRRACQVRPRPFTDPCIDAQGVVLAAWRRLAPNTALAVRFVLSLLKGLDARNPMVQSVRITCSGCSLDAPCRTRLLTDWPCVSTAQNAQLATVVVRQLMPLLDEFKQSGRCVRRLCCQPWRSLSADACVVRFLLNLTLLTNERPPNACCAGLVCECTRVRFALPAVRSTFSSLSVWQPRSASGRGAAGGALPLGPQRRAAGRARAQLHRSAGYDYPLLASHLAARLVALARPSVRTSRARSFAPRLTQNVRCVSVQCRRPLCPPPALPLPAPRWPCQRTRPAGCWAT